MSALPEAITLDGPAGAGKTTLGHWLADELGYRFLESGYLYRAAAQTALAKGVDRASWDQHLLAGITVTPRNPAPDASEHQMQRNGDPIDIRNELFTAEVDAFVTEVAMVPELRQEVTTICRSLAARGPTVISGRDIGKLVLPEAGCKIYLKADSEVRSERMDGPWPLTRQRLETTLLGAHSKPAADALVIDTSDSSIECIRAIALAHAKRSHEQTQR
jgi:cytidylate kinase